MALASEKARFSALKVGYDGNADDDIDDSGDHLAVSNLFTSTSITRPVSTAIVGTAAAFRTRSAAAWS